MWTRTAGNRYTVSMTLLLAGFAEAHPGHITDGWSTHDGGAGWLLAALLALCAVWLRTVSRGPHDGEPRDRVPVPVRVRADRW